MPKITQLVKGIHCNANCPMCLSLHNDFGNPDQSADIRNMDDLTYYNQLSAAYLKARNHHSTELVITSYGDPLDKRNRPHQLVHEIKYARLAGFEQITLITNGIGLSHDLIDYLYTAGLTHLSVSLHATDQATYEKFIGVRHSLEKVLLMGQYAAEKGLIVRHNYMWHTELDFLDVLEQSWDYGATQITLIEAVPCNNFAQDVHAELPEVPKEAVHIVSHSWGMEIYELLGTTVAWCRFGQDDPDFDQQEKNLYINVLANGTVLFREGAYFDLGDRHD